MKLKFLYVNLFFFYSIIGIDSSKFTIINEQNYKGSTTSSTNPNAIFLDINLIKENLNSIVKDANYANYITSQLKKFSNSATMIMLSNKSIIEHNFTSCSKYSNTNCTTLVSKNIADYFHCVTCQPNNSIATKNIANKDESKSVEQNLNDFFQNQIVPYFEGIKNYTENYTISEQKIKTKTISEIQKLIEGNQINCNYFTNLRFLILPTELKEKFQTLCMQTQDDSNPSINEKSSVNYLIPYLYFNNVDQKNTIDEAYDKYISPKTNSPANVILDIMNIYSDLLNNNDFYKEISLIGCNHNTNMTNNQVIGIALKDLNSFMENISNSFSEFKTFLNNLLNFKTLTTTYNTIQNYSEISVKNPSANCTIYIPKKIQNYPQTISTSTFNQEFTPTINHYLNTKSSIEKYCLPSNIQVILHVTSNNGGSQTFNPTSTKSSDGRLTKGSGCIGTSQFKQGPVYFNFYNNTRYSFTPQITWAGGGVNGSNLTLASIQSITPFGFLQVGNQNSGYSPEAAKIIKIMDKSGQNEILTLNLNSWAYANQDPRSFEFYEQYTKPSTQEILYNPSN